MRSEGGGFRLHMRSMGRSVESWISSRDQWRGENRLHEISRKQKMGSIGSVGRGNKLKNSIEEGE